MEPKTPALTPILKSFVAKLVLLLPTLILFYAMFSSAVKTVAGILYFDYYKHVTLVTDDQRQTARNIQKYFRDFETAIDLNDIINAERIKKIDNQSFSFKGCLERDRIAFVPVKIKLPYYGVKVFEWCMEIKTSKKN